MRKLILFVVLILTTFTIQAQETEKDTTKVWTKKGNMSLLLSQSAYNRQWLGGGTSNVAGNFGLNYDFNYKKGDVVWDNKFILAYGLSKIKGNENTAKTDDRLELNSLWGKKAKAKNWYYSMYFNFKSQMDIGLDKNNEIISHFFSPAYFQFGPGFLWKKDNNASINISPAAGKLILVHKHFTDLGPSFGVLQGDNTRFEFGASISAYYKFVALTNVTIENRLNLYSNYLEDPQNIDIDYQLNIVMTINKYLSTNFTFQTIYDDNAFRGFQTRQNIGLGVNYGF